MAKWNKIGSIGKVSDRRGMGRGAVGDDNIQRQTQGSVNPESWAHGSSKDRKAAFNRGYSSGELAQCSL